MARTIFPRTNFYDGQNITEDDMDTEQAAMVGGISNTVDFLAGSGVEQEFSVQRTLFDTSDVPALVSNLITTQNFDGEAIYPEDSLGNTVFTQPSDSSQGVQLEVEISGSSLDGTPALKVYIFGTVFNSVFKEEVFFFENNESQISRNYFTKIVAIMTQDFRGNQNILIDGVASRNRSGRLRILEALPMAVARDTIMAEQVSEPNQNYVNFKPASLAKTLDVLLDEIAQSDNLDKDDLNINVTSTTIRKLLANETGVIVGQKFLATTDNIQKISVLLSVEERLTAPAGEEFDWSGSIVVGIRKLQATTVCPTDIIPNSAIDFDPEPSALSEMSFSQDEMEEIGIVLDDTARVVDFIFTNSALANPNVAPDIVPGSFYAITIRRSGDVSVGNIVLEEAANTEFDAGTTITKKMTTFSQNKWTDVPESNLWFQVHTDAIRIVDGTAFDNGVQITSPRVKNNESTGIDEPYVEGHKSLIDISESSTNYVILQKANSFTTPRPHPATGNLVFTRIEDVPSVAIVSETALTTLIDAGNKPIILGAVTDTNPRSNPVITGTMEFPGLVRGTTFTLINPSSDLTIYNLEGSTLVPNLNKPQLKYRIIKQEVFYDSYGDINNDGVIDIFDMVRAQELGDVVAGDGYSKNLNTGSLPAIDQQAAIIAGTVTMEEIIRADVDSTGLVDSMDPILIQQYIILGTAFLAGATFTRVVLTVEDLTDPLGTTADIIGTDPDFNDVPFTEIDYRIDFVNYWSESYLEITDLRRFVPKVFTEIESTDITGTIKNGGKNTSLLPGDVQIGGELLNLDSTPYSVDLEVNSITIELPDGYTAGELDVFTNYINGEMAFSDGTLVTADALTDNQVKVVASIQSYVKDINGHDYTSPFGLVTIDQTVSVLYTQSSGLLRIRAGNIVNSIVIPELRTKIVLAVYLKKAGFANSEVTVSGDDLTDLIVALP